MDGVTDSKQAFAQRANESYEEFYLRHEVPPLAEWRDREHEPSPEPVVIEQELYPDQPFVAAAEEGTLQTNITVINGTLYYQDYVISGEPYSISEDPNHPVEEPEA